MLTKKIVLLFVLASVMMSCEVTEGEGGTAKIKGKLILEQYNDDFSLRIDSSPAADERIYIQYGDEQAISDDVKTSYNGYFEFPYLYKGDYTVFYYSIDSTDASFGKKEIILNVKLSKGETLDLGYLKSLEILDFDDGRATIKGTVYEVALENRIPQDTIMATEKEVYLCYGNHEYYDERIRTQPDGTFYFQDLIPGNYVIYVMSEDIRGTDQEKAIKKTITVTTNTDTVYTIGDYYIYNL